MIGAHERFANEEGLISGRAKGSKVGGSVDTAFGYANGGVWYL
jgi:hypothetical protein